MGANGSCAGNSEDKEAKRKNDEINKMLSKEKKSQKLKLLLLGAGESGKSTFAKQIRTIYMKGYENVEERKSFRPTVYQNIFENMKALVQGAIDLNFEIAAENKDKAQYFLDLTPEMMTEIELKGIGKDLADNIKTLWADKGVQSAFENAAKIQLNDSAEYFIENLDRIAAPDYIPSAQDIYRARVRTVGINEIEFKVSNFHFVMTDVGGQRSERKKWIHCFQDVNAIIFCASLSEYDQKLREDGKTNRMYESLKLFRDVSNLKWFWNMPTILFLNKKDIFEKKIQKVPLNATFVDYKGGNNFDEASKYIQSLYESQIQNKQKLFFCRSTNATDTSNIKFIFNAIKDVILTYYLDQVGFSTNSEMPPAFSGQGSARNLRASGQTPPQTRQSKGTLAASNATNNNNDKEEDKKKEAKPVEQTA
eukprot:CAMPEP_0168557026 /NCGR_PEP_ID=MMETSP0413-20121227/9199_1 /TAXON_ID=136452 /ORGANISM="Filamoeba nolandi, Strain NC-AS-23-1" /LENGTH=421 /DNA_ID=CAMNT_0008588017 /DNA_START=210 /DNA_END=1475 /DNA_ORIENTATION=+